MTADKRIDGSKMELFTLNWGGMLIEFVRADKFLKLEYDNLALIVEKDDLIKRVLDKSKQVGCLSDKVKFLDEQNITFGIQNTELRREIAGLKAELYTERLKPDTSSLGETINDILNYVPPPENSIPRVPYDELVYGAYPEKRPVVKEEVK